jgi:hypothetical protein
MSVRIGPHGLYVVPIESFQLAGCLLSLLVTVSPSIGGDEVAEGPIVLRVSRDCLFALFDRLIPLRQMGAKVAQPAPVIIDIRPAGRVNCDMIAPESKVDATRWR